MKSRRGGLGRRVVGAILVTAGLLLAMHVEHPSVGQAAVPAEMAQGFAEIVKRVTPAVVNIAVTGERDGEKVVGNFLPVRSVARPVKNRPGWNRRLVHLPLAPTVGLSKVPDPASSSIPTAIS